MEAYFFISNLSTYLNKLSICAMLLHTATDSIKQLCMLSVLEVNLLTKWWLIKTRHLYIFYSQLYFFPVTYKTDTDWLVLMQDCAIWYAPHSYNGSRGWVTVTLFDTMRPERNDRHFQILFRKRLLFYFWWFRPIFLQNLTLQNRDNLPNFMTILMNFSSFG